MDEDKRHRQKGGARMKVSAIAPVLNEQFFLPLYLKSVSAFADEILIVDGGSTDNSVAIIEQFRPRPECEIRLFSMPQTGLPYTGSWNETAVRNFLVDQAGGDWIVNLDADEMFDDLMLELLPELLAGTTADVYQFPFVCFWGDLNTVRVNAPGDAHWSVNIVRMWRNGIGIRYNVELVHCTLQAPDGRQVWSLPYSRVEAPVYHYHYALGPRFKFNDLRRADLNRLNNDGEPDFGYKKLPYEIRTVPFGGKHPTVVEAYLAKKQSGEAE